MSDNELPAVTLPRAPRGSKTGWPVVTGQVPPDTNHRLLALCAKMRAAKGDVIWKAIDAYLDREAA